VDWGCSSVVEYLPNMNKILVLIHGTCVFHYENFAPQKGGYVSK
jgi:hypothetical protein